MNATTAVDLAAIGRGFSQPGRSAQQVFRAVLEAMSRPGRVQTLTEEALRGLDPPGLGLGLAAVLLTLLDADSSVWLDAAQSHDSAATYLRFHTGVRVLDEAAGSAFAVVAARQATSALWNTLDRGTDEVPQSGATLIVEVDSLSADARSSGGSRLSLRGPGIAVEHTLWVCGLDTAFWQARATLAADFPRGIDLILCCGDSLAAIARTTRVTVES